jgi:tRNA A-37 threonylcarbamoyl transferase component Bud32
MDVDRVQTALQGNGFHCEILNSTRQKVKLQISNEEDFYGLKGFVTCVYKGRRQKICASFLISQVNDDLLALSLRNCTLKVARKAEETYLKFIVSANDDESMETAIVDLREGINQALLAAPHMHSCGNTMQFTEALTLKTPESSQQYTRSSHSVVLPTVVIEGNEQDMELFRANVAEELREYILWGMQSGSQLQGRKWYLCPSDSDLPSAQDWLMSLHTKGICFKQVPCEYLYYHTPSNDYRLLPAPRHPDNFTLTPVPPRDSYQSQVAQELAMSAAEHQDPCVISLNDPDLLSRISAADRLPIDCFTEQDLTKCEIIGKGGFGNILLNTMIEERTGERIQVAMKVIKPEKLGKASNLEALIQEYRILRSCAHQDIIKVFGYILYQTTLVIVMEYCSKKTLFKYVVENHLEIGQKVALLMQVANGLTYLHAKGICHLDLKPQNILVDSNNTAKLSDFGLSKTTVNDKKTGKSGYTLLYSAPEQIDGKDPGLESDIWAYGNIMYFVLFGKGPIDYMKAATDNVHSFATKKLILSQLNESKRKPIIPLDFEQEHPKLAYLMRNCWVLDGSLRLKAAKLHKSLAKLYPALIPSRP